MDDLRLADTVNIRLVLPYPPSANRYWRHDRGVTHLSDAAKMYRNQVDYYCHLSKTLGKPIDGDIEVHVIVYRPRKIGDLDNSLKVLLDSLRGLAFHDDKQVVAIVAVRRDDKTNPRVEVVVKPYESAAAASGALYCSGIVQGAAVGNAASEVG